MTSSKTLDLDEWLAAIQSNRGANSRIFVAPEQKVLWVSLNKNACTSLKWMMASLMGEDLDRFATGLMPVTNNQDAIQNRGKWEHAKILRDYDPAIVADIHAGNGWFVFAVVRDPRNRLFSAWQNKLLLENPGYTHYRDESWYPRHPLTAETVVEDFERFVDMVETHPNHSLRQVDPHFRDQADLLIPHLIDYTKIYEITELKQMQDDLRAHLAGMGWTGELYLPRSNDTPLRVTAAPFANGVRERIEKMFAADFELFPGRWDFAKAEAAEPWTDHELREAEIHAGYGRRIGDLRERGLELRDEAALERKRADDNAARVRQLVAEVAAARAAPATEGPVAELRARLRRPYRIARAVLRRIAALVRR